MEKILVVIPAYNCEKQISRLLSRFDPPIQLRLDTIMIINNQSDDNTESVAIDSLKKLMNINAVVLRNDKNYGYGGSLKIGFEFAIRHSFDWVIVLNGDDQSSINDFLPILNSQDYRNAEVMWGCRFLKNSKLRNYSISRTIANYVFNFLFKIVLKKPVHDIGCGVYLYSKKILEKRFYSNMPDVLYIGSFLRLAHDLYKHKLVEFPIYWNSDDQHSTVKVISQTISHFKMVWQYLIFRDKFLLKDHRTTNCFSYRSKIVFSNISTEHDLNSQDNFVVSFSS